jgi:hypothetical protein
LYGYVGKILANGRTRKLKTILIGFIVLIVSGCALPVPLSYLSYGRMAYDANQIIQGDATTTDVVLSLVTDMECKTMNLLGNKDICIRKVERDEYNHPYADCNGNSVCLGLQ